VSCAAPATGPGFLAATLAHLDCQAQTIGTAGYQALASPGSPLSLALTMLLSLFVAIIGIRYMIGRQMAAGDLIVATLKVGFVLVLATSWPAYQNIVYGVVLKGPAEIAGSIGRASSLPGSDGGLAARLQGVDNGILALVVAGSGRLDITAQRPADAVAPPLGDDTTLGLGKTLFVSSIIGSFGLLRLAGGLFLALAPLFAGFLLFEATRFLFFGWLRALIAVAIGSLGISVVLGVELAIIEPWLSQVLALRAGRIATLSAPFELLALALAFSLVMLGVLALSLRISFAAAAATTIQVVIDRMAQSLRKEPASTQPIPANDAGNTLERTRAQLVAQSVSQTLRREAATDRAFGSGVSPKRDPVLLATSNRQDASEHIPLGRSYHAQARRVGAQAMRRNPIS
jgi:type IV secretion system protein VirB6